MRISVKAATFDASETAALRRVALVLADEALRREIRATLDVPKPKSGGLVKKVGPFSKRTNPL